LLHMRRIRNRIKTAHTGDHRIMKWVKGELVIPTGRRTTTKAGPDLRFRAECQIPRKSRDG
jgi:hypothetical protein